MTDEQHPEGPKEKHHVEVYWTTVSYKTVALIITAIFVAILSVLYLMYPERFANWEKKFRDTVSGTNAPPPVPVMNQARFVALDGKVEVKKVNSVKWVAADQGTTLNKGDLIQTGGDGLARITFPDGSTYTVKSDTLITVEENTMTQDRATRVGVHITSGAVDLATSSFEAPNSSAEVSFENARASVRENSKVAVRSDPESKQHEITVSQGAAAVERTTAKGTVERVELVRFDRMTFPTGGTVAKSRVLAPPELLKPVHLSPITVAVPKRATVSFEWNPVAGAAGYRLSVSTSAMFTSLVADKRTSGPSAEITGLDAGDYFWSVRALDAEKQVSEPSETFKFSLFSEAASQEMFLEISESQVHGNLVEIVGRTEPGATVLIGGQPVGNIQPDGSFRHFTAPLPKGSHEIVITGQNRRGGTKIRRVRIVIQ